jgi:hypothetical protein
VVAIGLGAGLGVLLLIAAANFLRDTRQAMAAANWEKQPWDE